MMTDIYSEVEKIVENVTWKQGWYDPTDEECKKRTKNDRGIDGQIVDEYRGLYDIQCIHVQLMYLWINWNTKEITKEGSIYDDFSSSDFMKRISISIVCKLTKKYRKFFLIKFC